MTAKDHPPTPDLSTHLLNIVERLTIIEQMSATVITEQDEAKVSRREIHRKLETINNEVTSVKGEVKTLKEQVDGTNLTLAIHERVFNQLKGGGIVIAFIWSIALIAVGVVIKSLWMWAFSR